MIKNYKFQGASQVLLDDEQIKTLEEMNIKVIKDNFIDIRNNYIRHDSEKIGKVLLNCFKENNMSQE